MKYLLFLAILIFLVGCKTDNTTTLSPTLSEESEDAQKEIEEIIDASTIENVINEDEIQQILQEIERLAEEAGVE